jgi:enterochelin esterase family protein
MEFRDYQALGLAVPFEQKDTVNNINGPNNNWSDASKDASYTLGPLSAQRKPGTPAGRVIPHLGCSSEVFPGTTRDWYVYVPSQYDRSQPCHLLVFQDGIGYLQEPGLQHQVAGLSDDAGSVQAATLLDNMIHTGAAPVTIAVFINPGSNPGYAAQRSLEYDTCDGTYARFLAEEILPQVEAEFAVSADPLHRCICGASSGGICAFNVAWHRPDLFLRVISHIGSFANIRGGHHLPWIVRNEPRREGLRVFLQDGYADADNNNGSWPLANEAMAVALRYAGYDSEPDGGVQLVMGEGPHSLKHGGMIMPETLAWIWGSPAHCTGGAGSHAALPGWVQRLHRGESLKILTYGTSLTAGGAWVSQLEAYLHQRFPHQVTVVNVGAGAMWSQWGVENLRERVIDNSPDVLFIEFGMNDAYLPYETSTETCRTNLYYMIQRTLETLPRCSFVLMTMNVAVNNPGGNGMHADQRPELASYYEVYREAARSNPPLAPDLTFVDLEPAWAALLASSPAKFDEYVPDRIHPGPLGCAKITTPGILAACGLPPAAVGAAKL